MIKVEDMLLQKKKKSKSKDESERKKLKGRRSDDR